MAHNVPTIDGVAQIAYQGETPWHKLGQVMETGVHSVDDVIAQVPVLGQNVSLQQMFLGTGIEVPKARAVVRDNDSVVLGTVGEDYKLIQYRDAFSAFQPAIDRFGLTVEVAGVLGKGERAWMLFKLGADIEPVPGDRVTGYGVATTGHDGHTTFQFRPTPIRTVCQNTLDAANAFGGRKGRIFGVMHTGNDMTAQIAEATTLVSRAIEAMQTTGETFSAMARKEMTPQDVVAYIESVFPSADNGDVSKQLAERRKTVSELIWTGVGSDLAMSETGGEPNPWACYNAVTEYFDHVLTAKSEKAAARSNASAIFGTGADVKLLALSKARELVLA